MNKLFCLSLLAVFILGNTARAEWVDPSEKYADVYKLYENRQIPFKGDGIQHFVYFARDRDAVRDHPFLECRLFQGAQIMYLWANLEPEKDQYDFSNIAEDYEYLKSKGKKLFIQLQDATFDPALKSVPPYLFSETYDKGAIQQFTDKGVADGWIAKRWNRKVRERYACLLNALGQAFDGKIEGINLQETSAGVNSERDPSFTPSIYRDALKANMLALKQAFPTSVTMQYANFMPGEWLPWNDNGFLLSIYQYGEQIGVGLGAPDLLVRRKGHLNHSFAMMHEHPYRVPLGIAVQDGNYVELTGADFPPDSENPNGSLEVIEGRKNIVPMLHAFAKEFLGVKYMFWVNQEPYFEEDVLPFFKNDPFEPNQ